jgi:putative flippase GtrA
MFLLLLRSHLGVELAAPAAFLGAAAVNYCLSVAILFRHRARWSSGGEIALFFLLVSAIGSIDLFSTRTLLIRGLQPWLAKSTATGLGLILNFWVRRFVVFREAPSPEWDGQQSAIQRTGAAYRVGR